MTTSNSLDSKVKFSHIITTGFAMFSMFFGAGNVVFPLALGQHAQDQNIFAIFGLLITAVGVPFLGLLAMTLYDGNYKAFFARMGPKTGFLIALIIMGLIGPFGAIPRCIALSFSTTQLFLPSLTIEVFSAISCAAIFLFTFKRSSIMDVLGNILTPFLLLSLGIIIVKGILYSPHAVEKSLDPLAVFLIGLKEGYQTMDLLGAFFFSSVIITGLKKYLHEDHVSRADHMIPMTIKSICIGAPLLALVYIGFSFVSSFNASALASVPPDQMIGALAIQILGSSAGIVACAAVALACLTTAIALASVSAEYIHEELSNKKVPYLAGLIITLIISYYVSTLNFTGIVKLLGPVLEICYPSLILLTILNICHKLWGLEVVKTPVIILFAISVASFVFNAYL
jgi:LIVCS family branched-chain amino acid:cation transporter